MAWANSASNRRRPSAASAAASAGSASTSASGSARAVRILVRRQPSVAPVADQLGRAFRGDGHDRRAGGPGLDHHVAQRLDARRADEQVGRPQQRAGIIAPAEEAHPARPRPARRRALAAARVPGPRRRWRAGMPAAARSARSSVSKPLSVCSRPSPSSSGPSPARSVGGRGRGEVMREVRQDNGVRAAGQPWPRSQATMPRVLPTRWSQRR